MARWSESIGTRRTSHGKDAYNEPLEAIAQTLQTLVAHRCAESPRLDQDCLPARTRNNGYGLLKVIRLLRTLFRPGRLPGKGGRRWERDSAKVAPRVR